MRDLVDQTPFKEMEFTEKQDRQYFDNHEDLREYLARYYVAATKPWEADEIAAHELSHGECALGLGVIGVKYSVGVGENSRLSTVFMHMLGGPTLTNLASIAISAHPFTAWTSRVDRREMLKYGYKSREHVRERVERWNEQQLGIHIPEPETEQQYLERLECLKDNT